ncbi:MAG: glycosyltransferase family 39 protein [Sterolibacterium sp.]|nr:glycosyltransferase family 39 protein [Sterolibacterium sp.]MBP9799730.1 glycosyltransferase family 39 protein [Sterolibacterium sp.]
MTRNRFLALLAATLLFRFWLAATLPVTGDEAYFIWWGKVPDWGFYDHPPLIGWWLAALLQVSEASWWLRLPTILLPSIMAWATARFLAARGESVAWGAAALILLAPLNIWNVLITTDTALVYCAFFSALAFLRAARDDDGRFYALAGLLLAGAVLSKYFAALLGFAYLLHALIRPGGRKWRGLLLCFALVLPALLLMAWWNAGHCWANVMFNFVNRNSDAGLSWKIPLLYVVMMLYALTPPLLWQLWRRRAALVGLWRDAAGRALLLIGGVPLLLFGGLSLVKQIGLHWVLSFLPFVLILPAVLGEAAGLRRLVNFFAGFALVHVLLFVTIAQLPLETWQRTRLYDGIVLTVEAPKLLEHLQPYAQDYVFASDGYSSAVTLGYYARRYFLVFGPGSAHARHDDILTDFRTLAGRNILILRKTPPAAEEYAPYFRALTVKTFTVRGATYTMVLGQDFQYPVYRDTVLARVREQYYALPAWLPQTGCYFCDRYFSGTACHK